MAKRKTRKIYLHERREYGGTSRLRKGCGWEVFFGTGNQRVYVNTDKGMREALGKWGGAAVPYCVGSRGQRLHSSKKPVVVQCIKKKGKRAQCTTVKKRPGGGTKLSRPFCLTPTGKRTKSC